MGAGAGGRCPVERPGRCDGVAGFHCPAGRRVMLRPQGRRRASRRQKQMNMLSSQVVDGLGASAIVTSVVCAGARAGAVRAAAGGAQVAAGWSDPAAGRRLPGASAAGMRVGRAAGCVLGRRGRRACRRLRRLAATRAANWRVRRADRRQTRCPHEPGGRSRGATLQAALAAWRAQARRSSCWRSRKRLQQALYEIADLAGAGPGNGRDAAPPPRVLGSLMYAENCYIVALRRRAPDAALPVLRRPARPLSCADPDHEFDRQEMPQQPDPRAAAPRPAAARAVRRAAAGEKRSVHDDQPGPGQPGLARRADAARRAASAARSWCRATTGRCATATRTARCSATSPSTS